MGFLRAMSNFIIFYILISFLGSIWLQNKSYEFRVKEIKEEGRTWAGTYFKLSTFPAGIRRKLGLNHKKVLSENEFLPMSLSTGGLRGSVHLLYTSLSEFLTVYHSPFQTSGDTGRHFINMTITVLQGEVKVWDDGKGKVVVHQSSDQYSHRIGERCFVEMAEDTYLLIYGRGLIPLTMGYWVSDSLFSSLDPASAVLTLSYYARAVYWSVDVVGYFSSWWQAICDGFDGFVDWAKETFRFQGSKSVMTDT